MAVSWIDTETQTSVVKLILFSVESQPEQIGDSVVVDRTPTCRVSGFPRLAVFRDKLIMAYQDPDTDRIKLTSVQEIR